MPAQEQCLRDLVACGVCPQLNHAIAQAVADGSQQQRNQQLHDVSYTQMLAVLRSLPITDYSGQLEETLKTLLDAMRAAGDAEEVKKLASQVVGDKVPISDWGMTSGTTGASKYFPLTALSIQRSVTATGKHMSELQLTKFALQPYREPEYVTTSGSSSSSVDGAAGQQQEQQQEEQQAPAAEAEAGEWRHRILSLALAGPCEELPGGQFVGSISSVLMVKLSKLGFSVERDLQGRELSTRPVGLIYQMAQPGVEAGPRYYALWLCAAANPGLQRVTLLNDLFAGNMLTAITVLQQHWQDLVTDLTAGEMTSPLAGGLPAPAVDSVNQWLAAVSPAARAANAQHIQRAMTAHAAAAEAAAVGVRTGGCDGGCGGCDGGSSRESSGARVPLLGLLMPNLHAVTVVVTGSHSKFWPSLRQLLPAHVPVCTSWHAGTEGLYGITRQLLQPGPWDVSLCPTEQQFVVMAHGNCFFEFMPVGSADVGRGKGHDGGGGGGGSSGGCGGQQQQQQQAMAAGSVVACLQPGPAQHDNGNNTTSSTTSSSSSSSTGSNAPLLTLDEVVVGGEYELVVSTFSGLTRYRVGDVVRVEEFVLLDTNTSTITSCCCNSSSSAQQTATDNMPRSSSLLPAGVVVRLPVVSFLGRVGVVLNLVWEKYDEQQLLLAVRDTVHTLQQQQQHHQQQRVAVTTQPPTPPAAVSAAAPTLPPFPGLAEFTVFENHKDEGHKHYSFFWELTADVADRSSGTSSSNLVHSSTLPAAAAGSGAEGVQQEQAPLPPDAVDAAAAAGDFSRLSLAAAASPSSHTSAHAAISSSTTHTAALQAAVASWAAVLNRSLCVHNSVYAGLLAAGQVAPATIQLVSPGAFKQLKEQQVEAKGISPSQFKMPTVVGPDSSYAAFLRQRVVCVG